jgi:hypothetical protein
MIAEGFARRFLALRSGKNPTEHRLTHQESLAVGQVEPPGFEMTRASRRFFLAYNGTAPTGVVPVTAFPTTAAQWVVWNNDPIRTYFFTALGAIAFSGTDAIGGVLLATVFQAPVQSGANATGLAVLNASNGGLTSKAIIKSSVTISQPAVPSWAPVADTLLSAVATVPTAKIANRQVDGRVAVPPGQGLGLAVLGPTGTSVAYVPMAEWVEQETDME